MISFFIRNDRQLTTIILHVMLGVGVTLVPALMIGWIFLLLASTSFALFQKRNQDGVIHHFLGYYVGMEIMTRIAKTSPYVPYESGKYFMFVLFMVGILLGEKKVRSSQLGWVLLLLLVPSFFVLPPTITYKDIVFNSMGIINLALGVIYFSKTGLSSGTFISLMRIIVIGLIPVLASVIFRTPDFDDIKFTLAANFDTSAGFGSNQVSTVLSLGFLLIAFSLLLKIPLFTYRWVSIGLLFLFFFRALLTFSRGGLVGALLILFLVWVIASLTSSQVMIKGVTFVRVFFGSILLVLIFYQANQITQNTLLLRYQGETTATLSGRREKDISVLTSNRYDLVLSDMLVWQRNIIFGVGPGASKYARVSILDQEVAAHVELSRLLAEHGIFGLAICLLLIFYPVYRVFREPILFLKLFQVMMFGYALFTTFHSAMRTNVTPFLFAVGTAVLIEKIIRKNASKQNTVHRQSVAETRA